MVIPSLLVNNLLKLTGNAVVCTLVLSSLSWMRYEMDEMDIGTAILMFFLHTLELASVVWPLS